MEVWEINKFWGGLSEGKKRGIDGSFVWGEGLDYRSEPDSLTALKKIKKDSGNTVTDLPVWAITSGTDTYFYGNTGKFYKRTSAGTWSVITTVSDSVGNGMGKFADYIYLASNKSIHRYGPLSGTPAMQTDYFAGVSIEIDKTLSPSASNIYTTTTAVNEGSTHRQTFTAGVDNITGVVVRIITKGTGNVTLEVHNSSNAVVASKTIDTGDLTASTWVRFMFNEPSDLTISNDYHFHIYSTVADTTIRTDTASDLETAAFTTLRYYNTEDMDKHVQLPETILTAYTVPTVLTESPTAKIYFTPDKTTQTGVSLAINMLGAGSVTVTVHDSENTQMATKTIANGSLKAQNGFIRFTFDTPWSAVVGAEYHIHVTSSAASTNVPSSTATDINDSYFATHYQILESHEWHPMMFFPAAQGLVIGNGNFLALWDGVQYRTSGQFDGNERLKFAEGENVRTLDIVADHLVMGTWQGDDIDDHGEAHQYFWDGTSPEFTNFQKMQGELNALKVMPDNLLMSIVGGFGQIYAYDGSTDLIKTIPNVGENKYMEVYPGAITNWNGITLFGISNSDSTTLKRGVYSYGRRQKDYSRSLNFDYAISTGQTDSDVQIGAVLGVGPDRLFVGWKDGSDFGVDIIDTVNDQSPVVLESRIFDAEKPYFSKKLNAVKLVFEPLTTGQSFTVKYKINREVDWQTLGSVSFTTYGAINSKSFANEKEFKEIQLQITLTTSSTDAPKLISIATFFKVIEDVQEV